MGHFVVTRGRAIGLMCVALVIENVEAISECHQNHIPRGRLERFVHTVKKVPTFLVIKRPPFFLSILFFEAANFINERRCWFTKIFGIKKQSLLGNQLILQKEFILETQFTIQK